MLSPAGAAHDFSDLAAHWTDGVEVLVPAEAARDRAERAAAARRRADSADAGDRADQGEIRRPPALRRQRPSSRSAPRPRRRHAARALRPRPRRGHRPFRPHAARSRRLHERRGRATGQGRRASRHLDQAAGRRRATADAAERSSSTAATSPSSTRPASRSPCRRSATRWCASPIRIRCRGSRFGAASAPGSSARSGCSPRSSSCSSCSACCGGASAPADRDSHGAVALRSRARRLLVARRILTLPQLDEAVRSPRAGTCGWATRSCRATGSTGRLLPGDRLSFRSALRRPDQGAAGPRPARRGRRRYLCAAHSSFPGAQRERDDRLIIATAEPGPETVLFARRRWGNDIEFAVASKFDIVWAVQTAFAEALSHRAVFELAERDPKMSAQHGVHAGQVIVCLRAVDAAARRSGVCADRHADRPQCRDERVLSRQFPVQGRAGLRSAAAARSSANYEIEIAARALRDEELPVFTVLVPMFREPEVLPQSRASAARSSTIRSASSTSRSCWKRRTRNDRGGAQLGLEGVFEVIRVPPSLPQTKPKACNFALRFARGDYLVIYDAEDRPEPDQLRKVVGDLPPAPPEVACLQCRLNYYNADENWLSRMFTLDYSLWFDLMLPGLERFGYPDPARRHLQPFQDRGVARTARLGPVQRHRGCRSRHPADAEGLPRRRRRFDDLRGGELPCRQLDSPALALDQGLYADLPGAHAPALASHPHHRLARLSRLRLLHRRHGAVGAVQSDVLADLFASG